MTQIDQLLAALKKALKVKGVVYRDLAKALDLSESSVKRVLSSKSLTLGRLEEICQATGISFSEICRDLAGDGDSDFFNEAQEKALSENPRFFHYAMLLSESYTPQKILRDYDIKQEEAQKYLLTLDRLRLIELHPRDRVKAEVFRSKRFRKEGPMGRLIFEQTRDAFLQSQFNERGEMLRFQSLRMSAAGFAKAQARLEKVMSELREDSYYEDPEAPGTSFHGVMLAVRPWKYSWMDSIKKRK